MLAGRRSKSKDTPFPRPERALLSRMPDASKELRAKWLAVLYAGIVDAGVKAFWGDLCGGLVKKMTHAGENHRQTEAVRGGNDVVIPDGASGLDECGGARLGSFFDAVGEGKEGV
jgi:hypothetical protein